MISVVIPLYNKEKSIAKTIDSVLKQTFSDFEIIVVNDGSTDGSVNVVNQIKDSRIHLINTLNEGVSSARNKGIYAAKGEYVAFLDGDDLWAETYLSELSLLISDFPNYSIYGIKCIEINSNDIPQNNFCQKNYFRGPVQWNYDTMCYSGSSTCVKKSDAINVGLFDTRLAYGEDKDLWFRLQLFGGGVCYHKPLAFYRQDAENRAMKKSIPLNKHLVYYLDKYDEARKNNDEFRAFFDAEVLYVLYPYLLNKTWEADAKRLAKKIDYSVLKKSFWFRIHFPYIYAMYLKCKRQ